MDWSGNFIWEGANKNKGIGIFVGNNIKISRLEWDDFGLQQFISCRINDTINLLAVWTKQANSPNFRYIGQLWKYIQKHKGSLSSGQHVICGDFNSNVQWDEWDRWWNHSDVVRELQEIDIQSLYHRHYREAQGSESRPTFFLHRNVERPYHIDYAFASKEVFVEGRDMLMIGSRDEWLVASDHLPLTFTISGMA